MHHLIKHGYDEYATWETFDWFIDTMKEILTTYRNNHDGYPVGNIAIIDPDVTGRDEFCAKYDAGIDRMIELLDRMDEGSDRYTNKLHSEKHDLMNKAKDEFFKIFSEYFYNLWD
jgi:hypothetical protein